YIRGYLTFVIWIEELYRGRIGEAGALAHDLMQVGQQLNDPRCTGLGLMMLGYLALTVGSYTEALKYGEQLLSIAVSPWDQEAGTLLKGYSLVVLGQVEEGTKLVEGQRSRAVTYGYLHTLRDSDPFIGLAKIFRRDIRGGIRFIEEAISKREKEGDGRAADGCRITLCEVYLQIIAGNGKLPLPILLRNLPILLKVMMAASSYISSVMTNIAKKPLADHSEYHHGHAQLILGLLYKIKKKRALALEHLTEAKRALSKIGKTPTLARVDAPLAELEQ